MSEVSVVVTGACGFIGVNLCRYLAERGYRVTAVDREPQHGALHCEQFYQLDLNDFGATSAMLMRSPPHWVLHLAARTDLGGTTLEAYVDNIAPTRNLLTALQGTSRTTRAIVFSSMLEDTDRKSPAYYYGLSKKRTEELCAEFAPTVKITVVRPASVWGPFFGEPYRLFFRTVLAGRFVSCKLFDGRKTFAYIGNLVAQVEAILKHQDDLPSTLYLGDHPPLSANELADEISRHSAVRIRRLPSLAVLAAALFGSFVSILGGRFPITLFRLSNMRKGRVVDVGPITRIAPRRTDLAKSVQETLEWLEGQASAASS